MAKKSKVNSDSFNLINQIDNLNQIAFRTLMFGSSPEVDSEISDTFFNDYEEFFHEKIKSFDNMYRNLTKSQINGTDNSDLFTHDIEKFSKSSNKGYLCNPLNNILMKLITFESKNLNQNQKSAQNFLKMVVQSSIGHNKDLSHGTRAIFKLNSGKKNKGMILNIPNYLFSVYSGVAKFDIEKLKLLELNKENYEENKLNKSVSDAGILNTLNYFNPKIPKKDMEILFEKIDESSLSSEQIDILNDPNSSKSEKGAVLEDVLVDDFREEWKTPAKSLLNLEEINFARNNIFKDLNLDKIIVDLKFLDFEINLLIDDLVKNKKDVNLSEENKVLIENTINERNLVAKSINKPQVKLMDLLIDSDLDELNKQQKNTEPEKHSPDLDL